MPCTGSWRLAVPDIATRRCIFRRRVWRQLAVVGFGVGGSMMRGILRHMGLEARMFLSGCVRNASVLMGNASVLCLGVCSKIWLSWLRLDCGS